MFLGTWSFNDGCFEEIDFLHVFTVKEKRDQIAISVRASRDEVFTVLDRSLAHTGIELDTFTYKEPGSC